MCPILQTSAVTRMLATPRLSATFSELPVRRMSLSGARAGSAPTLESSRRATSPVVSRTPTTTPVIRPTTKELALWVLRHCWNHIDWGDGMGDDLSFRTCIECRGIDEEGYDRLERAGRLAGNPQMIGRRGHTPDCLVGRI